MENKLIISPKTKVAQLLDAYPQLEDVLINYAPQFKQLKNPILRKTVAKVATLQQVAVIGNCKLEDLINHLRKNVGQDSVDVSINSNYNFSKPDWFNPDMVTNSFDLRELLDRGEHPVHQVLADLQKLEENGIYKITAPFLPAPLIDKSISVGFEHYITSESDDLTYVFFKRK